MSKNRIARRVVALGASCLAVVALTTVPAGTAVAEESLPAWCTSTGELNADDLPATLPAFDGCDLTGRAVRDGAAVLEIQAAGNGVAIEGIGEAHVSLSLTTLPDGSVLIGRDDDAEPQPGLPSGVNNPLNPDPCAAGTASAYTRLGWKAYSSIGWRYNSSGVPAKVAGTAQSAFSSAGFAMADGHDSCGISTIPRDSFHSYLGGTSSAPAASASSCGSNDGLSVIGWGNMSAGGVLAVTCTWYQTDVSPYRAVASDMKYNTAYTWTTDVLTCVGALTVGDYDLKSVATHEWGHAFGLGHVSESGAWSSQTMSTNIDGTCQDNEATLGRGDLNGMISLYGAL